MTDWMPGDRCEVRRADGPWFAAVVVHADPGGVHVQADGRPMWFSPDNVRRPPQLTRKRGAK